MQIHSSYCEKIKFDLTNLPNQIVNLELYGKFNLVYLPESLKRLKLSNKYELEDFIELPVNLKEIYIGKYKYTSLNDLLDNYEKKIDF